ncbi:MAG: MATE family efflux transporter, partial [Tannerellaceae bacterium]
VMNHSLKEYGGDLAIGAYGIITSLAMLLVMLILGVAQGMQPIVGFNYGAGRMDRVHETLRQVIIISTVISGMGFLASVLFPGILVKAFTGDGELLLISERGLQQTMLGFFVVGSQISISQFFQSIGMAWKAIFLNLSRQCVFLIPAILLLPPFLGLSGVWLASPFSDLVAAVVAWGFLWHHVKSIKNKG